MAASAEFLSFLKDQMAGFAPVTLRRMFSGAGVYRDGVIFALVVGETLYFKADALNAQAFDAEGLGPFTYDTKTGPHVIASYRKAPGRCLDDPDEMAQWCRIGWEAGLRASRASTARRPRRR